MRDRRDIKNPLDLNEISDSALRKNVFRELGKDLSRKLKDGYTTDGPGSIARLMEMAFKAGVELGSDPNFSPTATDRKRRMTDMDVPSLPREQMYRIRMALGIDALHGRNLRELNPQAMVMFMRPKLRGLPSSMSRDGWLCVGTYDSEGLSNKVVNPYLKLGLYTEDYKLGDDGWRIVVLSEWGFELMLTGETSGMEARSPGTSSTYKMFREALGDDPLELVRSAGATLKVI